VAYYRKSKGRAGISRQRATTTAMIEKLGGRIVTDFTDTDRTAFARVGTRAEREDFTRMLAYLASSPDTRIAAWHADRISRNFDDAAELIKGGYYVETVRGGAYDLSTATGRKRFKADILDAEYEVDHMIERIAAMKAEHAAEGRWLGGRRSFGWQPNPESAGGLDLDPVEAPAVAAADRAILAGRTTHAIAKQWNEAGTLTSTRYRWTPGAVREVLVREKNWAPPPARWPPLVDKDTHRAVVAILTDPARRTSPGPEVVHLLSGIARCGMCWTPMTASSSARERSRLVYRCRNGQTGREGGEHVARAIDSLDVYVTEVIIARLERPDAQALLLRSTVSELPALEAQRATLDEAMRTSNELRRQGLLTPAEFAADRSDHVRDAAQLDARIAAARQADMLEPWIRDPEGTWDAADVGQRRALIRRLAEIVVIPQAKGRPKGWKPGQPYLDPDTIIFGWKPAIGRPRRHLPASSSGTRN